MISKVMVCCIVRDICLQGPAANGFSKEQLRNEEFGNLSLSDGLRWVGGWRGSSSEPIILGGSKWLCQAGNKRKCEDE